MFKHLSNTNNTINNKNCVDLRGVEPLRADLIGLSSDPAGPHNCQYIIAGAAGANGYLFVEIVP